jgi:hypothetical protein
MFKKAISSTVRIYSSRAREMKDAVGGTAKEMAKDAKNTAKAASNTLKEDFRAMEQSAGQKSDELDAKVRGTDKVRLHAADEAAERASKEENKFVFSDHAESPLNKAMKMAHEAKQSIKTAGNTISESAKSTSGKIEDSAKSASGHVNETVISSADKAVDSAKRAQSAEHAQKSTISHKLENAAETVVEKGKFKHNEEKLMLFYFSKGYDDSG